MSLPLVCFLVLLSRLPLPLLPVGGGGWWCGGPPTYRCSFGGWRDEGRAVSGNNNNNNNAQLLNRLGTNQPMENTRR